jgi:hypothetical protein
MQITDLNKFVNLFLVGSLALTIVVLLWIDKIHGYVFDYTATVESKLPNSLLIFVTTLLALASVMFVGCVIDGLSEIVFRSKLGELVSINLLRKFFWVGKQYQETESCPC